MVSLQKQRTGLHWHYAWVIVVVTFVTLLVAAGVRAAPTVFIKPLEAEFGWDRGGISLAVAISLFAYGFGGPLGGSLIDRFGPRRVMLAGLSLIGMGLTPLLALTDLWQLDLLWGLVIGVGTGTVASVLGATVAHRWFNAHRGTIIGLFGAAVAAGQLIFLPLLVAITSLAGWRSALALLALAVSVALIPVVFLMRNRPEDVGTNPYGERESDEIGESDGRVTSLREAMRTRDFWLLAGSFFICGYTTNGLIGTHLLPHTVEHGFSETTAAWALGLLGMMNIVGTMLSGWLSDRYDNRRLLALYYGFRAASLAVLPFIVETNGLTLFVIVYGLDWIATVPPTVNLTARRFGRASLGTLFGWIFCSHMIGAGLAAYAGGFLRDQLGDYTLIFLSAAALGFVAAGLSMRISSPQQGAFPIAEAAR